MRVLLAVILSVFLSGLAYAGDVAVTDLDGTLTPTNTLCLPGYCPKPYPWAKAMLEQHHTVLYLSCKPWLYNSLQTWWLEAYDFPEGESWAIGPFPAGCETYQEKCDFLKATGLTFDYGYTEDDETIQAYECAGATNILRVP